MSTSSSVKTGTEAYRCRKTVHSRRKTNDNMRCPFGDVCLTRSRIIGTICGCRPNENMAAAKGTVHLHNIRLNKSTSCTIVSVELLLIWNTNYDGNSSAFIDMWTANAVDVFVYPLWGLRASKKQLHCWQSMFKTQLLLMTVGVEDLPFDVSGRCRRLSCHCWQLV
jgi:hypothetical protein